MAHPEYRLLSIFLVLRRTKDCILNIRPDVGLEDTGSRCPPHRTQSFAARLSAIVQISGAQV
jgi:hypothetical protein